MGVNQRAQVRMTDEEVASFDGNPEAVSREDEHVAAGLE